MLIDSNIIIEIARNQKHSQQCEDLINAIKQDMIKDQVYLTRFALSAIEALIAHIDSLFVREILLLIYQEKIQIINFEIKDDLMANAIQEDLKLDFDDAIQFIAANQLGTYLVTYDKDFSHTSLQTKTPEEVLDELAKNA